MFTMIPSMVQTHQSWRTTLCVTLQISVTFTPLIAITVPTDTYPKSLQTSLERHGMCKCSKRHFSFCALRYISAVDDAVTI